MDGSLAHPSCGSPVDYLWVVMYSGSGRDDLCLDRLVLGVGNEPGVEQPLRLLKPPHRIIARRGGGSSQRRSGHDLDAARTGAQLLELAHPPLLAPGLVLRLADSVHRLRLVLAQALELDPLRALRRKRGQIGRLAGTNA